LSYVKPRLTILVVGVVDRAHGAAYKVLTIGTNLGCLARIYVSNLIKINMQICCSI